MINASKIRLLVETIILSCALLACTTNQVTPYSSSKSPLVVSTQTASVPTRSTVSQLENDIGSLEFVAGKTTIAEFNSLLGKPTKQKTDGTGTKIYVYSTSGRYEFSEVEALVSGNTGDFIDEILLGLGSNTSRIVDELGKPNALLIRVPDENSAQITNVPDLVNVFLWWTDMGALLQISCNRADVKSCKQPSSDSYGQLFLIGRNHPMDKVKQRVLKSCPKCILGVDS